jgi:membrane protein YdbS with pleckstrin-like domain
MAISKKLLSEGEHVVLSVRTHVKALLAPLALLILVVAAVITAAILQEDTTIVAVEVAVVAVPVVVIWVVIPFLRWLTSTYTVTSRRLITRHGIITRTGRDIPLFRINDVAYEKGLLDRILGCGPLIISDATEKAGVVLPDVPNIEQVHLQITDLLFTRDDGNDDDGSRVPVEPPRNQH